MRELQRKLQREISVMPAKMGGKVRNAKSPPISFLGRMIITVITVIITPDCVRGSIFFNRIGSQVINFSGDRI